MCSNFTFHVESSILPTHTKSFGVSIWLCARVESSYVRHDCDLIVKYILKLTEHEGDILAISLGFASNNFNV